MRPVRSALAHLVWWVGALVALGYASGVLLVGLHAPAGEPWVEALYDALDVGGGGVLDRDGALVGALSPAPGLPTAFGSWGVASAGWLLAGWVLSVALRPRRSAISSARRR